MKLEDFSRALREEAEGPAPATETRARVIAQLERVKRRRAKRVIVLLPIAAVLAGATASAAVTGKIPAALHAFARVLGRGPSEPKADVPAASAKSQVIAAAPVPSTADSTPIPEVPSAKPVHAKPIAKHVAEPPAEPSAPDSLALYRAAHRLHFAGQDPAGALAAWDAYLAADPEGAFALEARYNRALCLVRLGRTNEAREALAPFARGVSGGYRKSEARALLDLLDREGRIE